MELLTNDRVSDSGIKASVLGLRPRTEIYPVDLTLSALIKAAASHPTEEIWYVQHGVIQLQAVDKVILSGLVCHSIPSPYDVSAKALCST